MTVTVIIEGTLLISLIVVKVKAPICSVSLIMASSVWS